MIDDNIAERFIKLLVNERSDFLFYESDRMARVSVIYHILFSTFRQMKASTSKYSDKLSVKVVRGCANVASMFS